MKKFVQFIPTLIPAIVVIIIVKFGFSISAEDAYTIIEEPIPAYLLDNSDNVKKPKHHYKYKISKDGKEFIKSYENCKLTAYRLPGEKYNTIGWGHYLQRKEEQNIETITQKQADKFFEEDIKWVNDVVTKLLNEVNSEYKWTQNFVDGLCSLVYCCGEGGIRNSKFYKRLKSCRFVNGKINKSDLEYTLASVKTTNCTKPGHYPRRAAEYEMMSKK